MEISLMHGQNNLISSNFTHQYRQGSW